MISLNKRVWQIVWELWEHRNEVLHCQENVIKEDELDKRIRQIRHLFFKAYSALKNTRDGYLLAVPLASLEKKSSTYMTEWITKTKLALICATRKGEKKQAYLHRMRVTMKSWLRKRR